MESERVTVLGRGEELAALTSLLGSPDRLPSALVLEGEAGIGKTTLWVAAVEEAKRRSFKLSGPEVAGGGGFDWEDAGIGAGTILGMILLGGTLMVIHRRHASEKGSRAAAVAS